MKVKLPSAEILQHQSVDVDVSRIFAHKIIEGEQTGDYFTWKEGDDIFWTIEMRDCQLIQDGIPSRFGKDLSHEEYKAMLDKKAEERNDIRTFDTGAIRDSSEGKEDYSETISWRAFKRYAQYMTGKKKKYGAGNFKKGMPIPQYEESLLRHVQKYMENKYEGGTVEPDEDHLSAMVFNIFGIMHQENKCESGNKKNRINPAYFLLEV